MSISLEKLMEKVPNRYQLVLVAARRANELAGNSQSAQAATGTQKKVAMVALKEIADGGVQYETEKNAKPSKS